MSILLYRNYFYRSNASVAEGHLVGLAVLAGIGYACAALLTPAVTRRLSKQAWITVLIAASAVVTVALGETFVQIAFLAIGFACISPGREWRSARPRFCRKKWMTPTGAGCLPSTT